MSKVDRWVKRGGHKRWVARRARARCGVSVVSDHMAARRKANDETARINAERDAWLLQYLAGFGLHNAMPGVG